MIFKMNKAVIKSSLIFGLLTSATFASVVGAAKPNFIIFMADDMGYGDTSVNNGWIQTPNMDRMAEQGLVFTDFHSSGTVCSPTRAGLLTGRYQERCGVGTVVSADPAAEAHSLGLDPSEVTFSRLFKNDGYATAIFGKWHVGYDKRFNPVHHGFDEFRGFISGNIDYLSHYNRMSQFDWWNKTKLEQEEGYTTHLVTQHSIDFIKRNKNKPFCLYMAQEAPHNPTQLPDSPIKRGPNKAGNDKRPKKDVYRGMVTELDNSLGQILDTLEAEGLGENTFVIFLSDNGPTSLGSAGPLKGKKAKVWEGGHRVPAIVWWPGKITPGTRTDQLAISLDIMPTMLDLAGISAPSGHSFDGISLRPLLLQGNSLGCRRLFWSGKAMRDGDWKLMKMGKTGELYNLKTDIGETTDLAEKYPERVQDMLRAIDEWSADVGL